MCGKIHKISAWIEESENYYNLEYLSAIQFLLFGSFLAVSDIHLETYAPFYVLYYILMALHLQLAQTAFGIQRRYHRLNLAIRNIFSLSKWDCFGHILFMDINLLCSKHRKTTGLRIKCESKQSGCSE